MDAVPFSKAAKNIAAMGMVAVSFLAPMAFAAKPAKSGNTAPSAQSNAKAPSSAKAGSEDWESVSMDGDPEPRTRASASASSSSASAKPVQPPPAASASASATAATSLGATVSLGASESPKNLPTTPITTDRLLGNSMAKAFGNGVPLNSGTIESSFGHGRISLINGYGQLDLPGVAVWVQPGSSKAIFSYLNSDSNSFYAYPLGPMRVITTSGDPFTVADRPDTMRRMSTYNRAIAQIHAETNLTYNIYRKNNLRVDALFGGHFGSLAILGSLSQLQADASGVLSPNANPPTAINSRIGDGFQGGLNVGLRLFKKTDYPFEIVARASPGFGAYSIGSSILTSDNVSHPFDIRSKWFSMPWSLETRFPTSVAVSQGEKGVTYSIPSVIRLESFGAGAFGSPQYNQFAYVTLSINHRPSDLARTSVAVSTLSHGGGYTRSLLTLNGSNLVGEKRVGADLKLYEYTTIPQTFSLGLGANFGYNLSSEVIAAGGYVDFKQILDLSGNGGLENQNSVFFLRGGYINEMKGDRLRRLPGSAYVSIGLSSF